MKAVTLRTGSGTIPSRNWTAAPSTPRFSVAVPVGEHCSSDKKSGGGSPRLSPHMELNRRAIRRSSSEPDFTRSGVEGVKALSKLGSRPFPARLPAKDDDGDSTGSLTLTESPQSQKGLVGEWPQCAIPVEELGFSGGGIGKNWSSGGGSGDEFSNAGDFADRKRIGAYYEEQLKSNPNNPLLLRNYGKYLHEVERDVTRAEEYYGRAILESPGDGEVLSLYGNLIWENESDQKRAKSYFDQAVLASPDDCMVLGSYAYFMWQAAEDDDDDGQDDDRKSGHD